MKNVLVTGGAGFIGFHLVKYLYKLGYNVTIIDDFSRGRKDQEFEDFIKESKIKVINTDMRETHFFGELDAFYDEIYHLAAVNGTKNFYNAPERVLEVNILSLMNILRWLDNKKCGKFIFTSSSEAYAGTITEYGSLFNYVPTKEGIPLSINDVFNPRFSYGSSKLIGEILTINYLRTKQVKLSIVRYNNIYCERMGFDHVIPEFCKRVYDKMNPFPLFGGEDTRAFCYVLDGVKATVAVMETHKTDGEIIHIGNSSEEIKICEMAKMLLTIADYDVPLEIHEAPEGSVKRRCPDTGKLHQLTGFKPEYSLLEGLKLTYSWYMDKYKEFEKQA
jgi:nucleoside-diphosphate-sugar epimerase